MMAKNDYDNLLHCWFVFFMPVLWIIDWMVMQALWCVLQWCA